MSVIRISANRTVVVVQRGALGALGTGAAGLYTIGQLAPFRIGDLVTV